MDKNELNQCSLYIQPTPGQLMILGKCKSGHFVNPGCYSETSILPFCVDEKLQEKFYPKTGDPKQEFGK